MWATDSPNWFATTRTFCGRLESRMETVVSDLSDVSGDERTPVFDDPKTIQLGLSAGESIPPHQHPGETILFHVIEGEIALTLGDEVHDLSAGMVARFSGDQDISPEATTGARAILVFVPQP